MFAGEMMETLQKYAGPLDVHIRDQVSDTAMMMMEQPWLLALTRGLFREGLTPYCYLLSLYHV